MLGSTPLCDIPSGCCSFTGPWTVTRSSLRMLRRVAAFCRPLRPVLLLVSFPRSRSPAPPRGTAGRAPPPRTPPPGTADGPVPAAGFWGGWRGEVRGQKRFSVFSHIFGLPVNFLALRGYTRGTKTKFYPATYAEKKFRRPAPNLDQMWSGPSKHFGPFEGWGGVGWAGGGGGQGLQLGAPRG